MMNTTDLTAAIATLEDKKQALTKRAETIDAQIQLAVQHTRELGEQQNAICAEQSAITQAIEWAQVAKYVVGLIEESKMADARSNIRQIK
jgi:hypothetical protein